MKAEKKPNFGVWVCTEEKAKLATVTITDKGIERINEWIRNNAPKCLHESCIEEVVEELTRTLQWFHEEGYGPRHYEFSGFKTKSKNPEWLELELSKDHYTVQFEEV